MANILVITSGITSIVNANIELRKSGIFILQEEKQDIFDFRMTKSATIEVITSSPGPKPNFYNMFETIKET